jgi:catechol O-methyltransferase
MSKQGNTDNLQVELGGYVGYSCILFGAALRAAGGHRYFSLERNPEFAAVIASLVDLAGLRDVVQVIIGASDASIRQLHSNSQLSKIDLLFLDHYKPAYLPDLKLCEELGLVGEGSVLAADNAIKPGNPPYLEYVRSTVAEKTKAAEKAEMGSNGTGTEGFADRTAKQYEQREGAERLDSKIRGVPGLVYESQLVESFEPTGEPVSSESSTVRDFMELTLVIGRHRGHEMRRAAIASGVPKRKLTRRLAGMGMGSG